ncbi:hypothetical protein HN020_02790 [Brevibacillus borstelensis]|nr:hypothetical protein [Brevibacillus borstelensis]
MASIEIYGKCVDDFEVSPFESTHMLHLRSNLDRVSHELTYEELMKLLSYDVRLINNAKEMSKHLAKIYDFSVSDEPFNQWWWHLDKVADGKISFRLTPDTI